MVVRIGGLIASGSSDVLMIRMLASEWYKCGFESYLRLQVFFHLQNNSQLKQDHPDDIGSMTRILYNVHVIVLNYPCTLIIL